MTLTSDKQPHKSIDVKNEDSSAMKKALGKLEECPTRKTDELGNVEQQKSPCCASFPKIDYQIFDNPKGKYNLNFVPRNTPRETSKGVQKIMKQISKCIKEENTFSDSNFSMKNKTPKTFDAEVKVRAKPKINCDGNGKKQTIKSEEMRGKRVRQNATQISATRESPAATTCSSATRSSRVSTYQLSSSLIISSDSSSTISTKTTAAVHSHSDKNSEASEPVPNKVRLKKLKRSEIPLRKTLPNALHKKTPVSVSLVMEKSLKEVESDVSIEMCQSVTSDDHFLMATQWSTEEKILNEIGTSESKSNVECDDFLQNTQLTRTNKTSNIPLDSQISSFELSKKTSISIGKGKRLNLGTVNSSILTSNKTNGSILQRLESLHQQSVSVKEKQCLSATSTELEELCSNSSCASSTVCNKSKQTAPHNLQKYVRVPDSASIKLRNKKTNHEVKENQNLQKNKEEVGMKSKISPGKILTKNKQLTSLKQMETSNSKNSTRNKYRFTLKEDSTKARNNLTVTDIRKAYSGKGKKKVSLKLRDDGTKPLDTSVKVSTIDGDSDAFETVKQEEAAKLTFRDDMTVSERAAYLLQLLIDQIPSTTSPEHYIRYKELMSFVGKIKNNSTFPFDSFEMFTSQAKESKKLPQSRNKFSTKGKPKKVKSDKIDLQEKMEKLYHSSSNHTQIKRKTATNLETKDNFEMGKHDVQVVVNISTEEGFGEVIGALTNSEGKVENVRSTSLGRLIVSCSEVDCSQGKLENELKSAAEKQEKIDKVLEETVKQENPGVVKKDTLADAVQAPSENPADHSIGLKRESDSSKGLIEKKNWLLNPIGHFSSGTSVKNKKQKTETKLRRNTTKPFEKVENNLNDLFEEIAALRLKRRNSEPNSFRGFVRKTTDAIIPKSNKTSVSSTCSSLRHLNTDELEDFRMWESVPMKMTSCWEISLYHIRRPWSVLSCSVFKDNQRASTPGIILENLRNGSSFESRRSISSRKSKVITPKEASFDVEPSIAQKNLDIRNWLSALNFFPPQSLSNDVLSDITCCNLPVSSSSQSKIMLKERKIPRSIKYSEETLSSKFSIHPESNRKWGFDLPKSKELVRRKSGGYVAVSRESDNHFSWTKHSHAHVRTQGRTKKEKVSRNESKITKCESVTDSKEKVVAKISEKAVCSIQVKETDFEEVLHESMAQTQKPTEIVESDFWDVVKESANTAADSLVKESASTTEDNVVKESESITADNFNIWKYLFFASLLIIIYNFSHNCLGTAI